MKRFAALISAMLLLLALTACQPAETDKPISVGAGVSVMAPETVFEEGTTVKAESVTEGVIFERAKTAVQEEAKQFTVFEITAVKDEAEVQPNGTLTVTFPIPTGYSDNVTVYYVAEDGGKEELETTVNAKARTATAVLSHFSTYVLADEGELPSTTTSATESTESTGSTETPETTESTESTETTESTESTGSSTAVTESTTTTTTTVSKPTVTTTTKATKTTTTTTVKSSTTKITTTTTKATTTAKTTKTTTVSQPTATKYPTTSKTTKTTKTTTTTKPTEAFTLDVTTVSWVALVVSGDDILYWEINPSEPSYAMMQGTDVRIMFDGMEAELEQMRQEDPDMFVTYNGVEYVYGLGDGDLLNKFHVDDNKITVADSAGGLLILKRTANDQLTVNSNDSVIDVPIGTVFTAVNNNIIM